MPLFLCQVIGTGTEEDPFRPALAAFGVPYAVLDARPDATKADGFVLVRVPDDVVVPREAITDPDTRPITKGLARQLGVSIGDEATDREAGQALARHLIGGRETRFAD